MFVFAVLSVLLFSFAFELRVPDMKMVVPGIIWVAVTFAGTLGLNRAFVIEQDKGSLAGLLLAPVDRAAIYFGKMLGNLHLHVGGRGDLAAAGDDLLQPIAADPTAFPGAGAGHLRLRRGRHGLLRHRGEHPCAEVMLPILLFPVLLPVMIAGVKMTGALLDGETLGTLGNWLQILVVYDIGFTVVAYLTFAYVVEE